MELYYEGIKKTYIEKQISSRGIANMVVLAFLISPFLYPVTISYALSFIGKLKYITGLYIIIWFAFSHPRLHTLFKRLTVFCLILVISTIYNKADLGECFKYLFPILVVVSWCDIAFRRYPRGMLSLLSAYCMAITAINVICLFIYPEGISVLADTSAAQATIISVNFISNDNTLLLTLLPGMCITMFSYEVRKKNTLGMTIILYLLFTFSMFKVWTGTGMAVSIVLGIALILDFKGILLKRISYRLLILMVLFLFIYICCLQMSFMKPFIEDFLGKSLDYTGRTYLWEASISMIKGSYFTGYGMQPKAELFRVLSNPISYSSHNMLFHLAIAGGILLPFSFISIMAGSLKTRILWKYFKGTRILAVGVIGVLLYLLFETQFDMPWLWILLSLMQHQDLFYYDKAEITNVIKTKGKYDEIEKLMA